ncbi:ABC transporter substrate-binding protein [Salinarimonas ramus]|uniref:Peptide ABC transporter substrate-binding protein n=1 Tax=Salinarimonas ramus TaxID=690164 RepID=A0A917QJY6_9HYPH|nr:ABC transporter substrate-binding protein [Salinarimonas ramus]GGK54165.1 peptide ABC transporter substrate-binding protein [Salinarimonas ramus]
MKKTSLLVGTALVLLSTAAGAETLRWGLAGDAMTLDPHAQNEGVTIMIQSQMMEPLVSRAPTGELEPTLATSWRVKEGDPNTWVFSLREGVTFHDGATFDSEDVVFSFERAMSPQSQMRGLIASVAEVRATGPYEVEITTKGPNPILPTALVSILMMDKDWVEANDAEVPQDVASGEVTFAAVNVNGTGAYELVSRELDTRTVMTRNEEYWGRDTFPMAVSEIVFTPIANPATRVAALLSGELDFVQDVPVQDIERVRQTPGFEIATGVENRAVFFGLNVADTLERGGGENPLADVRVRRAMNMAIDREAIQRVVMRGQSVPAGVIMPPFVDGWSEELNAYPAPDPEAAKALLAEAGYPDGFEIQLDCPNDRYINDEAICQAAVGMLGRIGIDVALNAMPKAQFFPMVNGLESDFYMLGWGVPSYDSEYMFNFLYHTRNEAYGSWNNTRYSNPELDAMIEGIAQEIDLEKRAAMVDEMWAMVKEDMVYVPIHHQMLNWAIRDSYDIDVDPDNQARMKYFGLK